MTMMGCAFYISKSDLDEMTGRNIHPVTVENHSPYVVSIAGNYDWKPVKIDAGKSWVINTDRKELVVTAFTSRWRGGDTPSMVSVGQNVKKISRKTTLVVLNTSDFPLANQ